MPLFWTSRAGRVVALAETWTPEPHRASIGGRLAGLADLLLKVAISASAPFTRHAMSSQTWTTDGGRGFIENMS